MPNLNKVLLMGNLTRDPELRHSASNTAVVKLGIAINRYWRNQQGERQEETCFVDCVAFGRTGEVINQYLRKGRPIFIEGRLNLNRWQDQEGNNRSKLEVVVLSFEFIDSRNDGGGGGGDGGGGTQSNYAAAANPGAAAGGGMRGPEGRGGGDGGDGGFSPDPDQGPGHEAVGEDDIPF